MLPLSLLLLISNGNLMWNIIYARANGKQISSTIHLSTLSDPFGVHRNIYEIEIKNVNEWIRFVFFYAFYKIEFANRRDRESVLWSKHKEIQTKTETRYKRDVVICLVSLPDGLLICIHMF